MASFVYDKGREAFLKGAINWTADTIKAVLVVVGAGHYQANQATDQYLSAVTNTDIIGTTPAFTNPTATGGVADADDTKFPTVSGSSQGGAIVIYKDTGASSTSPLIAYIDSYPGLPVTPNSQDINVVWPSDSNRIFKL